MENRECTVPAIAKCCLIITNSTAEVTSGVLCLVLDSLVEGKGKIISQDCLAQRRGGLGAPWIFVCTNTQGEGVKKADPSSFQCVQQQDKMQWATKENRMFPLNVWKHFLTVRMTEYCYRLPQEAVDSPSLVVFKSHVNVVCSSCPCLSRGLDGPQKFLLP